MLALLVLSCSLAADATAVSIAASVRGISNARAMTLALAFGAAQSIMAAAGWLGGTTIGSLWAAWDHWVALALLTIVGVKMIKEGLEDEEERGPIVTSARAILLLAIATSIDSLAVGVTLPTLGIDPLLSIITIGAITFAFSAGGAFFGRFLGARFGRSIEIAGGIGLIAIGIRIVIEHTT
jgi:putative Mn2+ efflux pump MntP